MTTKCVIIAKISGKFHAITCTYDGYETGVGSTLRSHYTSIDRISDLIALGDIGVLGERVTPSGKHSFDSPETGTTTAFIRDREADKSQFAARSGVSWQDLATELHNYVFVDGAWTHYVENSIVTPEQRSLWGIPRKFEIIEP